MSYEPPAGILIGADVNTGISEGTTISSFVPDDFNDIERLGEEIGQPALVPLGIVRTDNPNEHTTFKMVLRGWISPELDRRIAAGERPPSARMIHEALIIFPPREHPERHRVLFDAEVRAGVVMRPAYKSLVATDLIAGEVPLSVGDMFDLRAATLDGVNMEKDGFLWIRREGTGWALYFNFLPSSGFEAKISESDQAQIMAAVQDAVAQQLLRSFLTDVLTEDQNVRSKMAADGWCVTPILLPEPWREICAAYARGDVREAEAAAVAAVSSAALDRMAESWVLDEPFTSDRRFLETGIERYKAGDYISAVSVLLPRIEGLANRVREARLIGARDSTSQVFRSLEQFASSEVRDGHLATRIREEFDALVTHFLLARFKPSEPGARSVRGRHAHAHGATGDPQYDQVYALKIILALDALYFVTR